MSPSQIVSQHICEQSFSSTPDDDDDNYYTTYDGMRVNSSRSGDDDISQLLKNNKKWVAESQAKDPDFFRRIGEKQRPKYL
jgi:hypothetical protein